MEIRTNTMVIITPKMNLLQIPIIDKYYVRPSDPAALNRQKDFAAAKGLLSPRKLPRDGPNGTGGVHIEPIEV
jgi:glutamine amidotransferase